MDKSILLEEVKIAIQNDSNFRKEILNAVSYPTIDKDKAYQIIYTILTTFNLIVDDIFLRTDKISFSNNVFLEFVYNNIGTYYTLDIDNRDKNILNVLNKICSKINEKDYKLFVQFLKDNYPDKILFDIFEFKNKLEGKIKDE